jgi:holo-ACP synthase CitX
LTLSDKSGRSLFLEARDRRQDALAQALSTGHPATVFLSLNIPGFDKAPPGSEALFILMLDELSKTFSGLLILEKGSGLLGPYAIMALDFDPVALKKRCITLETSHPAARLVDLDVYSAAGIQIDRASLCHAARPCLVCHEPAVECIRVKRHSLDDVISRTHELLAYFRA